ncbi:GNAT family N-acetyltransferase [Chitinimonas naiadis]
MSIHIRKIEARDEAAWRVLWDGYCAFYQVVVPAAVTDSTWARIMNPASTVNAIVAEHAGDGVIGMATYVLHENTWNETPGCYLEDLFVDTAHRADGVGRALIDWLAQQMKEQNWSRLYWHTQENNYRARGLYDKYTQHSGAVRYLIRNPNL